MARFSATSTPSTSRSRSLTTKMGYGPGPGSIVDIAGRKLKLSPVIDTLFRWMTERHAIHQRRLAGQPWPWTDDPILRQHNFTNVFRIYDRVTQYVICNVIGKGDQDFHETCFRVILFRCFNRISTWELLLASFGDLTWREFNLPAYEDVLYREYSQNNKLYGSSYILPAPELGGTHDGTKVKANYANHLRLLKVMMESDLPGQLAQLSELSDAWERISLYPGMGVFLAFQLLLDLNMIPRLSFPEDWAACGPGAVSCLEKIFGREVKGVYGEALAWLYQTQDLHFTRLGISRERRPRIGTTHELSLVDFEHSLCECDVYSRKAHPEIKGRRLHIPGKRSNFSADRPAPPSAVLPTGWSPVHDAVHARARTKRTAPPPVDSTDPDPAWSLSHIVKQAPGSNGKMLYLVRYEGYGPEDDLWLFEVDLEDAPEVLAEWRDFLDRIDKSIAACRAM